jgi:ABC-type branched-subunit amino acid transport system substrate-binding protein
MPDESTESTILTPSRRGFLGISGAVITTGALSTLLSACGGGGDDSSGSKTLNLGWIQPQGGLLGPDYAPYYVGAKLAVKEINAAGGIMGQTINPVEYNDKGEAGNEPAAIRALQSKCHFVVGPSGSSTAVASVPSATQAKMIQTTFAASAVLGDASKYPYHYQIGFNTAEEGQLVASQLIDVLGGKKIGILREDSQFGQDANTAATDELKKRGISPVSDQVYPFSTATNLTSYVQKLKDAGADSVIYWGAFTPQVVLALKAMQSLDWTPIVAGHSNLLQSAVLDGVDPAVLKNVYGVTYTSLTFSDTSSPGTKQVDYCKGVMADKSTKGQELVSVTSPFYDFIYVIKAGIETAKSTDPDKVKAALDKLTDYDAVLSKITFTSTNHTGTSQDNITLASAASGNDPKAQVVFRRAIGS